MKENTEAFEKIYNSTYNQILKFIICRCSNLEDVNDIIQETYIEFYKALKSDYKIENNKAFLIGIAKNKIMKSINKKKVKIFSDYYKTERENLEIDFDAGIDIEQEFITKDNIEKIWNYLKRKNQTVAKIFYLHFSLEMTFKKISEELEMNEATVKTNLYRMLDKMKKEFGGEIIE